MALTIGQQLRAAREERGLSIQDLAHETRIHANSIRSLEEDDYSRFASITYAKSFLQLYSRHLDVDVTEALSVFQGSSNVNLHGSSLVSDLSESIEPMVGEPQYRKVRHRGDKPGGAPIFLGVILVILLLAIPTFYFLGYNADNPEDVATEIVKNTEELKENLTTVGKPKEPIEKVTSKKIEPRPFPSQEELNSKYRKPKPEPAVASTETAPVQPPAEKTDVTATPAKPIQATPIAAVPIASPDPDTPPAGEETPPETPEFKERKTVELPGFKRPVTEEPETTLASNGSSPASPAEVPKPEETPGELPKIEKPLPKVEKPKAEKPKEEKPMVTKAPLRAVPIVATPIRSTEEPDAIPDEDITPPNPQKDRESIMNLIPDQPEFDQGRNRFPRRSSRD